MNNIGLSTLTVLVIVETFGILTSGNIILQSIGCV